MGQNDEAAVEERNGSMSPIARRGLIAGLLAATGALVARFGARPVLAANGDPLILGSGTNSASSTTTLTASIASDSLMVTNGSSGNGVHGNSSSGFGVYGTSTSNIGVYGTSNSSVGVFGTSTSNSGIFGLSGTQYGVYGLSTSGVGVFGSSGSSWGVWGTSNDSVGVVGGSGTNIGVWGVSNSGQAGRFDGSVIVNGPLSVTGIKSAIVPGSDGQHRRLYCLESPESYFEDFGEATLNKGHTVVTLDPEFAALVHTDTYHVFLSEYGDNTHLYVQNRTATRFEVRSGDGQNATSTFSYRVVARRKDVTAPRLERVPFVEIDKSAALGQGGPKR